MTATSDLEIPEAAFGTFMASLAVLIHKGVSCSTVIDMGCADGFFFADCFAQGLFRDCVPLNIDANPLYEPSLRAIKDAIGGDYRITGLSDAPGEMTLTKAVHPYWSSLRPPGDPYWERIHKLSADLEVIQVVRLDDLVTELGAKPPFLLKLDIQGAEVRALRGARRVLAETNIVICEADIDDFRDIDAELAAAGFDLFDITTLNYTRDQSLGWFYPVYLSRRLAHLRQRHIWDEEENELVITAQEERRNGILGWLAEVLPQIKADKQRQRA
jgi:FkbM family methyltransferase